MVVDKKKNQALTLSNETVLIMYVEWRLVLIDLRNHGRSAEIEGLLPPHNMENAAKDLADLVKAEGWDWPDVVIGHSMGGKVALQFAQSCANGQYGDNASLPKQVYFRLAWSPLFFKLLLFAHSEGEKKGKCSMARGARL